MIIRLLDPPMHEFLPRTLKSPSRKIAQVTRRLARKCRKPTGSNPMYGHQGCRLESQPEIYDKAEAISSAIRLHQKDLKSRSQKL